MSAATRGAAPGCVDDGEGKPLIGSLGPGRVIVPEGVCPVPGRDVGVTPVLEPGREVEVTPVLELVGAPSNVTLQRRVNLVNVKKVDAYTKPAKRNMHCEPGASETLTVWSLESSSPPFPPTMAHPISFVPCIVNCWSAPSTESVPEQALALVTSCTYAAEPGQQKCTVLADENAQMNSPRTFERVRHRRDRIRVRRVRRLNDGGRWAVDERHERRERAPGVRRLEGHAGRARRDGLVVHGGEDGREEGRKEEEHHGRGGREQERIGYSPGRSTLR